MQRYGESAGEHSNQCVAGALPEADASPVGAPDAMDATSSSDAMTCDWSLGFDILNIGPCAPVSAAGEEPTEEVVLTASGVYSLDTTTGNFTLPQGVLEDINLETHIVPQSDGSEIFVIVTSAFEVSSESTLIVTGTRPLVIIASGPIGVAGLINVGGHKTVSGPAGGVECQEGNGAVGMEPVAGGGGGSFGQKGGDGASTDGENTFISAGNVVGNEELVPLRGGCVGGRGGQTNLNVAFGGNAGGAIELVSGQLISVTGEIDASGSGGFGGKSEPTTSGRGGGGGGSGGAVLLQAPQISIVANSINVNGGGGGGGSSGATDNGSSGNSGIANSANSLTGVAGGSGGVVPLISLGEGAGGRGGNGATNMVVASAGGEGQLASIPLAADPGGGGGGGGGLGRIQIVVVP